MLYRLESVRRTATGRNTQYVIRDMESGGVYNASRDKILELIGAGNSILGLKLGADKRVLIDKETNIALKDKKSGTQVLNQNPISRLNGTIDVYTGLALQNFIHRASMYTPRDCVDELVAEVKIGEQAKVIILHGIRRTGKTTAMQHTMIKLLKENKDYLNNMVYINVVKNSLDATTFRAYLNQYNHMIIFIDEITRVNQFVNEASGISDNIANRNVVVLAGTDSYAFTQAMRDSLYDRYKAIRLTGITYTEYLKLFNTQMNSLSNNGKIERFMAEGGVLSRKEYGLPKSTYASIQSAVVNNIINTIKHNSNYEATPTYIKYIVDQDVEQVIYTIIRIITDVCSIARDEHSTVFKRLNLNGRAYDFIREAARNNEGSEEAHSADDEIKHTKYNSINKEIISCTSHILKELEVSDRIRNVSGKKDVYVDTSKYVYERVCLIPSILFSIMHRIKNSLKNSDGLDIRVLTGELIGVLTENLVLSQCMIMGYSINFLRYDLTKEGLEYFGEINSTPEIDCIITNVKNDAESFFNETSTAKPKSVLIEVKHSDIPKSEHAKNLRLKSVEYILGKNISKRLVVYMGETKEIHGIPYVNIHDFLTNIKYWVEGE